MGLITLNRHIIHNLYLIKMKSGIRIILLSFLILCGLENFAQALFPVTIEEKVGGSSLIVEGKVVDKYSFWNPSHTMIFTSNKIEVYKVFKGSLVENFIEVVTHGGAVGNNIIEASDLLSLDKENVGVFFCKRNTASLHAPISGYNLWDVYSSSQGFVKYNLTKNTAADPFNTYKSISKQLYTTLQAQTGRSMEVKNPSFDVTRHLQLPNALNAPVISSFSPATVYAGARLSPANNVLTITGSGFGTPTGSAKIRFDDDNNAANSTPYDLAATDDQIISWTDTEIKVSVPTRAGTGTFTVMNDAGVESAASATLQVLISVISATIAGTPNYTTEANLMNDNGSGGYTLQYSISSQNGGINLNTSTIKTTFQRALNTFKEVGGANLIEGSNTNNQIVTSDNVNLIVMDNTNATNVANGVSPLPAGTLAVCYSYFSYCVGSTAIQKTEFDIIMRNSGVSTGSTLYTEGPCAPLSNGSVSGTYYSDLETTILHELGHGLNLGHITDSWQNVATYGYVNPAKLMNYAILQSTKRVSLDYSAQVGIAYAIASSANVYGSCGLAAAEMTAAAITTESKDDCPGTFPSTNTPMNTSINFDLAHTTSNKNVDPSYRQVDNPSALSYGVSITNTAYYALKTNAAGNLSISISNYTLAPTTPTTCTSFTGAYSTVLTIGVELSLYQTNSCPTGQSFPLPVAYRTFNANGSLTNITGLTANTTYLLMVDGIENTKATFTLTLTGSALPIKLKDFNGQAMAQYNLLRWNAESYENIRNVFMERSADGINYEAIGLVSAYQFPVQGSFNDTKPLPGNNYYRLAIHNLDGSNEYSKIVSIKRTETVFIKSYPNPSSGTLYFEMMAAQEGPYIVSLRNALGQTVYQKSISINGKYYTMPINVKGIGAGYYQLTVANTKGNILQTTGVAIN